MKNFNFIVTTDRPMVHFDELAIDVERQKIAFDSLNITLAETVKMINILAGNGEPKASTDLSESPKGTK